MKIHICYDSAGNIRQVDNGSIPPQLDGYECITQEMDAIDPLLLETHIVDVISKSLRPRTDIERAAFLAPKDSEIGGLVASELANTDQYMMSDRVVANRDDWVAYRQQLRDLSKLSGTASERLVQFPQRPDGADPTRLLRERGALGGGEQ